MTDPQTGQKIQIVTALEQLSAGKQQYILTNAADYATSGKVILTKQESPQSKVVLTTPDGNQLLLASDLAGQQIQVSSCFLLHPSFTLCPLVPSAHSLPVTCAICALR